LVRSHHPKLVIPSEASVLEDLLFQPAAFAALHFPFWSL